LAVFTGTNSSVDDGLDVRSLTSLTRRNSRVNRSLHRKVVSAETSVYGADLVPQCGVPGRQTFHGLKERRLERRLSGGQVSNLFTQFA
jgi:hypothetical protein